MCKGIEEFTDFAKEKFGVRVTAVKSDDPDTFEKIFCEIPKGGDYFDWA